MVVLEVPIAPTSVVTMVGALDDNSTIAKDLAFAVECDDSASGITYQLEQSFQLILRGLILFIDEYDVVIDQAAEPEAALRANENGGGRPSRPHSYLVRHRCRGCRLEKSHCY